MILTYSDNRRSNSSDGDCSDYICRIGLTAYNYNEALVSVV